MFGEISVWDWIWAAIMFAIGGAAGFFISRQLKDKRTLELEEKLTAARTELADYRGEVNQHFLKTSLLVSKLTNNYREVYEHLATGAQKLCNDKPGTPKLDLPDTKILPTAEADDSETLPLADSSESTVETTPVTDIEGQTTGDQIEEPAVEIPAEVIAETSTASEISEQKEPSELASAQDIQQPAPEDLPGREEEDEEVPLGAESTPSVETEPHKTHPSIH